MKTPKVTRWGDEQLLRVEELAEWLSCSKRWIYVQVHLKAIPYKRLGQQLRFQVGEIRAWIEQGHMDGASGR